MPTEFRRAREPIFNLPIVVMVSVAILVAIHAIRMSLPEEWDDLILGLFAFAPDRYFEQQVDGAPWPGGMASQIWSPFTYALLHNDLLHLISNCTIFAAIGNVLGRRMTAGSFVLFCAVMAPLSAIGELIIAAYQSAPVIGTSGIICAMMGALARIIFPSPAEIDENGEEGADELSASMGTGTRLDLDEVSMPPVRSSHLRSGRPEVAPIFETLRRPKVIRFILGFAVMNIVLVLAAPVLVAGGAGVAWMVHVAGFIAGFILFPWFDFNSVTYT